MALAVLSQCFQLSFHHDTNHERRSVANDWRERLRFILALGDVMSLRFFVPTLHFTTSYDHCICFSIFLTS